MRIRWSISVCMQRCDWTPFVKAALERNPVSIAATGGLDDEALIAQLLAMTNESIYSATRLAQPDEVWNFQRGDGVERAICLANIWKSRHPQAVVGLEVADSLVRLQLDGHVVDFSSAKGLRASLSL